MGVTKKKLLKPIKKNKVYTVIFFFNFMLFFHDKETPNLKTPFFKKNSNKFKKIHKTLIISGGSRNGNHLVWSLLDGNTNIPYLAGEDKFLSQIFWRNLDAPKRFVNELKKKKSVLLRKMSGINSEKWLAISKNIFNKKIWAGNHKLNQVAKKEFPNSNFKIDYDKYRKFLDENDQNLKDFYSIFHLYLKAFNLLAYNKNKLKIKNFKYKYIYAESGLRRELLLFSKYDFDFVCIVPVRKFESYYFSKIKPLFNSVSIKDKYIKECWEQWYHKTSDYLYLKKKYPKKFIIVLYEDLMNEKKKKNL